MPPRKITKQFFKEFKKFFKPGDKQNSIALFIAGSGRHPNVKFYKYYYWIYTENSMYECAADVFYKEEHKMSAKKAIDMMNRLQKENISFAYVSESRYRLGNKIWDYERLKKTYPDWSFAPVYEDDNDEMDEDGYK